ncbi:MAG: glycosyltransferase family 2 protein [Bacteroidetes bacterium]|nr:glycosyltransferase family 2 protein [Bacteroidota bacterium]
MELSIVATIYNDAALVQSLCEQICMHVNPMQVEYEIILVNDGSNDKSGSEVERMSEHYPHVKGIGLSRNYGQQIAMSAGMECAKGNFVLIMDGDLQNPPDQIPALYQRIKEGYDLVYTTSTTRNSWSDKFSSAVFWWTLAKIFKVKVVPHQLMMKIMTKDFLNHFNSYRERCRTVVGIVNDIGFTSSVIKVENEKRKVGRSHYGFFTRFALMLDLLISFSKAPLNAAIYVGLFTFIATSIASIYKLYQYFYWHILPGYTSTILAIFFFGSLNLLVLGFIGRYVANIYTEVQQRPLYHIQKKIKL